MHLDRILRVDYSKFANGGYWMKEEEIARLKAESLIFNQVHRGPISCLPSGSGCAHGCYVGSIAVSPSLRIFCQMYLARAELSINLSLSDCDMCRSVGVVNKSGTTSLNAGYRVHSFV